MATSARELNAPFAAGNPGKRRAIYYWGSTAVVCAALLFGIINFTFNDHFPEWDPNGPPGFAHLGLPAWFKVELILAKIFAIPVLLVPGIPRKLREFAYFGFGLTLVSAVIAHASSGDARVSVMFVLQPLIVLGFLVVSYRYVDEVRS